MASSVTMATNVTFSCYYEHSYNVAITYLVLIFSVIIFLECGVVIATIWRSPTLHDNTDMIVASLCLVDIILAISFSFRSSQNILFSHLDQAKQNLISNLLLGGSYSSCIISITHLGFAAIDRYIRISAPFYYARRMTKGRTFKVLIPVWVVGLVYTLAPVIAYRNADHNTHCIIAHPPVEYCSLMFAGYLLNVVVIFITYFKIAYVAFSHKKAANIRRLKYANSQSDAVFIQNRMAVMRSVKFFAVMFGVFLACTGPPLALAIFQYFYKVADDIAIQCSVLIQVNSLTNGLIYAFMRREFYRIIKMRFLNVIGHLYKF